VPMVIALNYVDIAKKKHLYIDSTLLGQIFGAPVIETIAIRGIGVHELVDSALSVIESRNNAVSFENLQYGPEVETRIAKLADTLADPGIKTPLRWTAIKLLEKDPESFAQLSREKPELANFSQELAGQNWKQTEYTEIRNASSYRL